MTKAVRFDQQVVCIVDLRDRWEPNQQQMKAYGMRGFREEKRRIKLAKLVAVLRERKVPIIHQKCNVDEVIDAMIRFEHSRLLYVVDDDGKLTGTISLGNLVRHVFSRSHEPQIHPRFLVSMITTETAKDIMQRNPVFAKEEEEVGVVLDRMIETNVKEVAVLDREKRVVADLTMVDLLKFLRN